MKAFRRSWLIVLGVAAVASVPAAGQNVTIDTLSVVARSSYEDSYLSLFAMDRLNLGPRMTGMGGAGLALLGGSEYLALNPASLLGITRMELQAEAALLSGGAGVKDYPVLLDLGEGQFLDTSAYRVSPTGETQYNGVSFGSPLTLFGDRGAFALSYRRVARAGRGDETRVELVGPQTNNIEATYGLGDEPTQGLDAVSAALSRRFGFLDLGVNLSWQSGTIERTQEVGVSVFGDKFLSGFTRYRQEMSTFNADLGGRVELGNLSLAGSVYLGHDLKFENGRSEVTPLPNPQAPDELVFIQSEVPDHTVSVPTMIGLGGAYQVTGRILVALDYWLRPWSESEITRENLDPLFGFVEIPISDTVTDTAFVFTLARASGEESFNANLEDTNSLRIGLEWVTFERGKTNIPIRFGFRKEKLTQTNVTIPSEYADPTGLIETYRVQLVQGDPAAEVTAGQIADLLEHNAMVFQGSALDATTFAFGVGVNIDSFGADLSVESQRYDMDRFFLDEFDPLTNPLPPTITQETRSLLTLSLATRWRF